MSWKPARPDEPGPSIAWSIAGGTPAWIVEQGYSCPYCGADALKYAGTNPDTGNDYYRCEACGKICK